MMVVRRLKLIIISLPSLFFLATIFRRQYEDTTPYLCDPPTLNASIACQENIYKFEGYSRSIFIDRELHGYCKARPKSDEGHVALSHMEAPMPKGQPICSFLIRTKCTFEAPRLLSFYKVPLRHERDGYKVPNLVHYIWMGSNRTFSYINYLSFYSVNKFLKPSRIILHGDVLPGGSWWKQALQDIPNVYFLFRLRPIVIQDVRPKWIEHETDVLRLQILYANGGIYLDMDVLVVRSFDPLRDYEATLGEERPKRYSNGIILAQRHSPFICVWLNAYREYRKMFTFWDMMSVQYSFLIAVTLPEHVHIEKNSLVKPGYDQADKKMFNGYMDWTNNFAIHVWHRTPSGKPKIPQTPDDLSGDRNTLKEVINYVIKAGA